MPASSATVYCLDASILIELHKRYWADIFRSLWSNLERLIQEGRVISPKQVRDELKASDDWLSRWAARHRQMFRAPSKEHLKLAARVVAQFPALAHQGRRTEAADPFLIAMALAEKQGGLFGSDYVVVTCESRKKGGSRIPNACDHFAVGCLSLREFIQAEGWEF